MWQGKSERRGRGSERGASLSRGQEHAIPWHRENRGMRDSGQGRAAVALCRRLAHEGESRAPTGDYGKAGRWRKVERKNGAAGPRGPSVRAGAGAPLVYRREGAGKEQCIGSEWVGWEAWWAGEERRGRSLCQRQLAQLLVHLVRGGHHVSVLIQRAGRVHLALAAAAVAARQVQRPAGGAAAGGAACHGTGHRKELTSDRRGVAAAVTPLGQRVWLHAWGSGAPS